MTKQERISNYRERIDAEAESEGLALGRMNRHNERVRRGITHKIEPMHSVGHAEFDKLFRK